MSRKLFVLLFVTVPLLVLVLVIVGLMVWPFISYRELAGPRLATTDLQNIRNALDAYKLDCGHFPTTQEGLAALEKSPPQARGWHGPYFRGAIPKDPWGRPYRYQLSRNGRFTVSTLGADNKPGGDGGNADLSVTE
ncbi:type II secretion system major pseudopilin GspG [Fimbriimonas ginsengisoli]|uniref:General secretion pathway protein G n=1 Tax=Fimbriimonas ginsengisoli Gsoil 348 TaxID=661478 RepID=A0A068NQJ2_FIMGI|nr:type II secretion system major pseudopilin GspG [Fimbriimonas ginsengisoli]AIE83874.1 general secretion pathway protein G [Fimbriimonas ginsengisoli Gsoil 348]